MSGDFWSGAGAALLGGGLSYLGGKDRNTAQASMNRETRDWNARQAVISRNWQYKMDHTAVQRRMRDLRKAGINPIIAGKLTGGAPSGATATAQAPQMQDEITPAVATALQGMTVKSEIRKRESEVDRITQELNNLQATESMTRSQIDRIAQEINLMAAQISKTTEQAEGLSWENIQKEIQTVFYQNHDWLLKAKAVSKSIGIELRDFTQMINVVLGKIFGKTEFIENIGEKIINLPGKLPKK